MVTETSRARSGRGIQFVSKPAAPTTGLGRYVAEIAHGVRAEGTEYRHAELRCLVPKVAVNAGRRIEYDLDGFVQSYPVRADVRPGYTTHLTSQSLATLLMTQRLPRPVVVTVHDIFPYLLRDDPELCVYRNRFDRLIDGLAMRALRRADGLIAISDYTKQTLVDALDIAPHHIDVIHNGVDTDRFKPLHVPPRFREQYGLPPNQKYVLHVGTEDPRKNLPLLLRAFARARRASPGDAEVVLLRIGAPAFARQRVRHEALCRELGITEAVRWLDEVPEAELPLFYNLADAFAFPSRYEGFGLPVLEALACGTPVVAVRTTSIPELVGETALLVDGANPEPFADALALAVLQGRGSTDTMQRRIAQARRFTWQRTVRGLTEVYARVEHGFSRQDYDSERRDSWPASRF